MSCSSTTPASAEQVELLIGKTTSLEENLVFYQRFYVSYLDQSAYNRTDQEKATARLNILAVGQADYDAQVLLLQAADAQLQANITAEAAARIASDTAEANARIAADATLSKRLNWTTPAVTLGGASNATSAMINAVVSLDGETLTVTTTDSGTPVAGDETGVIGDGTVIAGNGTFELGADDRVILVYRGSGIWDVVEARPPAIASQSEAEAGVDNTKMMTPLRVAQAIAKISITDLGVAAYADLAAANAALDIGDVYWDTGAARLRVATA